MADQPGLKGYQKVERNLNAEIAKIKTRTNAGLLAAGGHVIATSNVRLPVEYGKLKASGYSRPAQSQRLAVEIGYSAGYALPLHERMNKGPKAGKPRPSGLGVYWGPQGEPKWLEKTLREERNTILQTVANYAKVGR